MKRFLNLRRTVVLTIGALLGLALLLAGTATVILSTESGSRWILDQAMQRVNNLPGQQLELAGSEGTLVSGLRLGQFQYVSAGVQVAVDTIDIRWNPLSLMSAQVSVSDISLGNVRVDLLPAPATDQPDEPTTGSLLDFAPLPVEIDLASISIDRLTINQAEQQFTVDELTVAARLQDQALTLSSLSLRANDILLEGDLALLLADNIPLNADLQWQYGAEIVPDSGPSAGSLALSGDLVSLQAEHRLQQPFPLTTSGSIDTGLAGQPLHIDFTHIGDGMTIPQPALENLVLNDFNLITRGSPDSLQITLTTDADGDTLPSLSLDLDSRLQGQIVAIEQLLIVTPGGQLSSRGELSMNDGIGGQLEYQINDTAPLQYLPGELPVDLRELNSQGVVRFNVAGDEIQGTLQITEVAGEFGSYPFQGQGQVQYDDGALHLDTVRLSTAANSLLLNGTLAEQLDFSWQLAAPQLNQFVQELEGDLQASGQVSGSLENMNLVADIVAESISYEDFFVTSLAVDLQRQGQSMAGTVVLTDAGIQRENSADRLQSLRLSLQGTDASHQLTLDADSDFGDVELALNGGLGDGGFTSLSALNWQGSLEQARLDTAAGSWQTVAASALSFDSNAFALDGNCWVQNSASLCLDVSGSPQPESFALQLQGQLSGYPLSVFNHPRHQPGDITTLPESLPRLPEIVSLVGSAQATLTATLASGTDPVVDLSLLPRDTVLTIHSTEPSADQVPSATEEPSADEEPSTGADQRYGIDNAGITASLSNGAWTARAGAQINGLDAGAQNSPLQGSLQSEVQLSPSGDLAGELVADLGDIGWVSAFSEDLEVIRGSLSGSVGLSGNLDEPRFNLDVSLQGGQLSVPALGIDVDQLFSSVTSLDDGSISLAASAQSGAGTLDLEGLVSEPYTAQRRLQAQLRGTDFTLAETADLNLVVTPDVAVAVNSERIELSGELLIPTLVINLVELPEQAIDVSRDAVIINYPTDQPELAQALADEQSTVFNLPLIADLDIALGEQVSFNGFGLTTEVAGNLNVRQQANGTNLTYGELEIVTGQYTLYGRSLQIREGKLLFFGAYDNPALDIRATREVESATVGVLMNGTLKNINSQLFSTPALSDSDIIAIMITGKPFSEIGQQEGNSVVGAIANLGLSRSRGLTNQVREQLGLDTLAITNTGDINNSILTIGKYLTPDLFIRYGIGLFDHQSKLALDYSLTERITLQAETGEYQSVDVIYRVER